MSKSAIISCAQLKSSACNGRHRSDTLKKSTLYSGGNYPAWSAGVA